MPDAIAWVDTIAAEQAVGVCGAKMGRLAELMHSGVTLPQGFTVTVDAYRRHCAQDGLDEAIDAALAGLGPAATPGEIEAAAQTARTALTGREMDTGLASRIGAAYEELSARCYDVNVPTAVRSSAIGEDSGTASFACIFDTYLGVSGGSARSPRSVSAGPACSAPALSPTGCARASITGTCRWRSA